MPLIQALKRQRWVDPCEFETSCLVGVQSEFQDTQDCQSWYREKPCLRGKLYSYSFPRVQYLSFYICLLYVVILELLQEIAIYLEGTTGSR